MISHGDEFGRTQHGNNNAYCQDNELSWTDWESGCLGLDLARFTRRLIELRRAHPVLRRRRFFRGRPSPAAAPGTVADLTWLRPDGREMSQGDWDRDDARAVAVHLDGDGIAEPDAHGDPVRDDSFLLLFNAHWEHLVFTLPRAAYGQRWRVVVDTSADPDSDPASDQASGRGRAGGPGEHFGAGDAVKVEGRSLIVLIGERAGRAAP
jgi:isoamylase